MGGGSECLWGGAGPEHVSQRRINKPDLNYRPPQQLVRRGLSWDWEAVALTDLSPPAPRDQEGVSPVWRFLLHLS